MSDEKLVFVPGSTATDPAFNWKSRAMFASCGTSNTRTLTLYTILMAVLNRVSAITAGNKGVRVAPIAEILIDGTVVADCMIHGRLHRKRPLGTIVAIRDSFRFLADYCKMTDREREEMFEELRKWIIKDHRARSEN